jgi:hypothetical protein
VYAMSSFLSMCTLWWCGDGRLARRNIVDCGGDFVSWGFLRVK